MKPEWRVEGSVMVFALFAIPSASLLIITLLFFVVQRAELSSEKTASQLVFCEKTLPSCETRRA